jgi:flagellum-specific ATP synthase
MSAAAEALVRCREALAELPPFVVEGRVCSLVGTLVEAEGLRSAVGSLVRIQTGDAAVVAEVVGFRGQRTLLVPLDDPSGLAAGARVCPTPETDAAPAGAACLGRVLDGLGRPVDGGPPLPRARSGRRQARAVAALRRRRIERPVDLGVRAINALLTVGEGSRLGLFAGSGVGKSVLLGQIARGTQSDANVIALIGERGREVREFVERDLGDALARSVVVVATSDEAPVLRKRAALLASSLAEELRANGARVLLLMDSLSRFCAAQREIGLAAGEPPATRGYPPSVWSALPQLLERAGNADGPGGITGLYTVLVEADDPEDPIADACRALLDGHIVLSRRLAERGQFPAIDVLASVSRVMSDVVSPEQRALAARARALLATWAEAEDLVSLGAYPAGSDPRIDEALRLVPRLRAFLAQERDERSSVEESFRALGQALAGEAR